MTQIHTAYVDDDVLTHHRTATGAARAVADSVRERIARRSSAVLTDGEHALLMRHMEEAGAIDLNVGSHMSQVDGLSVERVTQIAFATNHAFAVVAADLLD